MAADGHLFFDTKIDESGFSGGVKKLGTIAKGGLKILGTAVAGTTAAMGAGIAAGVKYNSSIENYIANFEVLLGSADNALAHVEDLKKFAASTPFEMNDLAEASKTLLAFGTDASKTMPVMKQLGDVSLGNKEKFQSLALVYGQVSSQGKMMGQDLLQMINAGFNPLLEISKHTGESMESLKDKMSKGQIGIEELDQALQWATEDGGQFAGGMEKASKTMTGMISTLKDNAMALLGEVCVPISDGMTKTLLPAALDTIDQLTTAFREDGIEGLIEAGSSIISNVLLGIANSLPNILKTALRFTQSFIESLNSNLPSFISAGGSILSTLAQGVIELLPSLGELCLNIILQLAQAITESAPQMIPKGAEVLLNFAQGIINSMPSLMDSAVNIVTILADKIAESAPILIPKGAEVLLNFAQGIVNRLPDIAKAGIKLLLALVQGIANSFPKLIELVPKIINEFCANLDSLLPQILNAGVQILLTLGKGLIDSIPTIIENAGQIMLAIINVISMTNLFSQGKNLIKGLGDGLKSMFSNISGHAKSLIDLIKNPFKIDWSTIGKDIVSGIANGIKNGAHAIVNAAKGAAKGALNAAKKFLGIHSPSRVFRDQVGKYMALGMGVGFEKNVPVDDMEKSINGAVSKVQGSTAHVNNSIPAVPIDADRNISHTDSDKPKQVYEIHVHTDLDGREVAHEIVEYIDDELGEIHEGKERGL